MSNEILLANELSQTLENLSQEQKEKVVRTIDELGVDPLGNSFVIQGDDTPGGGLRAAYAGNLRILLRYVPDQKTVIITNVASMAEANEGAAAVS
jgi:mRNA-degrading endonuclease RelE of RelBE toxin-antitoxin system